MISIENEVFTLLAIDLRAKHKGINIYGEQVGEIAKFPCVIIEEKDNAVYQRTMTTEHNENHVSVMYEINVYSNKKTGKKSECKSIFQTIDEKLTELGFTRKVLQPIPNYDEPSIYRMVGRYTALVSKENIIYRR